MARPTYTNNGERGRRISLWGVLVHHRETEFAPHPEGPTNLHEAFCRKGAYLQLHHENYYQIRTVQN